MQQKQFALESSNKKGTLNSEDWPLLLKVTKIKQKRNQIINKKNNF